MGIKNFDDDFEDDDPILDLVPVPKLPYYNTLRSILEPYRPADDEKSADKTFVSGEIIRAIEEHHGVPQGPNGKDGVEKYVYPDDFTRAMTYCGFKAVNSGGLGLVWLMKKK